jgi:hypothetical protein
MRSSANATITKLMVATLDAAGISPKVWSTQLKIAPERLSRIRAGRACLNDAELARISRAAGEPWHNLILSFLGSDDALTADTRELLSSLHSLERTADAEAQEHGKRSKDFDVLRRLMKKSA